MNAPYELSFHLIDDEERARFETALHGFVALEADKPRGESSSVFARYDRPTGCWVLGFDTPAALKAFTEHWRNRIAGVDRVRRPSRAPSALHTNGS